MGDAIGLLLFYGFFALIGILISALIMRWIFRINDISNNLSRQTDLLTEISITQKKILKNQEDSKN